MIPDYRAFEDRLQRHQDLTRERDYDRLVKQVVGQTQLPKRRRLVQLRNFMDMIFRRRAVLPPVGVCIPVEKCGISQSPCCVEGS